MLFSKFYLCGGVGKGKTKLSSYDSALYSCGIGDFNLIRVSSIIPPGAAMLAELPSGIRPGSLVHIVDACNYGDQVHKLLASYIGIAVPEDRRLPGVIMEYSTSSSSHQCREIVQGGLQEAMERRGIAKFTVTFRESIHKIEQPGFMFCTFAACVFFP
ncbi:MAG: pyruvoyl-dependent arginine decarboxylase [Nanoarchaeota archaeon]